MRRRAQKELIWIFFYCLHLKIRLFCSSGFFEGGVLTRYMRGSSVLCRGNFLNMRCNSGLPLISTATLKYGEGHFCRPDLHCPFPNPGKAKRDLGLSLRYHRFVERLGPIWPQNGYIQRFKKATFTAFSQVVFFNVPWMYKKIGGGRSDVTCRENTRLTETIWGRCD